jgi:ribonuclease BN (tRNA processing enzyme)
VLGSGGPEIQTGRASSSYLIWRDGKARVLVGAGGGSPLRFGQSGARIPDLDIVLFTHLHVDHTADFAALVKSSFFGDRERPLPVLGPTGNRFFPATTAFLRALFDPAQGAYRYLGGFLVPDHAAYTIVPRDIDPGTANRFVAFRGNGIAITATAVVHAAVPALARGADLFVAHNAVPEGATGIPRRLHMPPSVIGRIAADAGVKRLVLSHRMLRTPGRESETLRNIALRYHGPAVFTDDLDCFRL